jgi:beta-glucanase (GH16 family)
MRRTVSCTLMTVLALLWVMPAADAGRVRVSMNQPRMVDADTAEVSGRVKGRDVVLIQRYARKRHRWVDVRKTRANSEGRYRTRVRVRATPRYYRAVAGGRASPARLLVPWAPARGTSDACGPRPRKADGSYWSCSLADNFSGTQLNRSVWMPQTAGYATGTPEAWACYLDDPSVLAVRDGALRLTLRQLPESIACHGDQNARTPYVAGMVSTYRIFSQQYGRFEARIKNTATTMPGLHEAFWLWPDDRYSSGDWPAAGEIDISETYSRYYDLSVPYLHYTHDDNGGPKPGVNTAEDCMAKRGVYNTYTLEWTATRLEILVNGTTCLVNTSGDPAFRKPYIVALTQAIGGAGNEYDGSAPLPATMTVDYVKVWK